jgi:hypothetical protein
MKYEREDGLIVTRNKMHHAYDYQERLLENGNKHTTVETLNGFKIQIKHRPGAIN